MQEELAGKVDKLKALQDDGFNVVTDKFGQFKMDYDANQKCTLALMPSYIGFTPDPQTEKAVEEGFKQ